ncbi:hypothetical protein PG991_014142 [Apiospora marii]|uniref:Uncharacterized protein n=1 Tax=Apiospora marii TaxID=335849 RepID=A0ABR1R8Z4_9PEZI
MQSLRPSPQIMEEMRLSSNVTGPEVLLQSQSQEPAGSRLSYYLALLVALLVAYLMRPTTKISVSAPFYKASRMKWMFSADTLVRDSYGKFRDRIYNIKATEGLRTLIPVSLISELKGLPEEHLSAQEAIKEAMLLDYTNFGPGDHTNTFLFLMKTKLSQKLTRFILAKNRNSTLSSDKNSRNVKVRLRPETESIFALHEILTKPIDWTPMKLQPFMLRVIARLSGSIFVGSELSRTEEWMETSVTYAIHVFIAVVKLQFFPKWLRPVAKYLVSELGQSSRDLARGEAMLKPIIEERLQNEELDPGCSQPDDFTQWLIDSLPENQKRDYAAQVKVQLALSAASIHTTSNAVTDCFYDLAAHPEYQEILREEANQVLVQDGGWDKSESMAKLQKLDSFMKESQRLAGNVTTFIRKVVKPDGLSLSDGTHLPVGTNLLAPLCGISRDERYFPEPEVFDGLRFWKLRQRSADAANRWQYTSITQSNLDFGLGKHACPGRFLAGNEIKLILANFLLHYDIKLKEGECRPEPMMFMMSKSPNQKAEIMFRRRS